MESLKLKNTLRIVGAAAALLLLASCSEDSPADTHVGKTTVENVYTLGSVVSVHPGESQFTKIASTDTKAVKAVIDDIDLTNHQYKHGWADDEAAEIGVKPIRVDAHVSLSGAKSNYIDNDAACDTLRVDIEGLDKDKVFIGAVSLSGDDDPVLVSWPVDDSGKISDRA